MFAVWCVVTAADIARATIAFDAPTQYPVTGGFNTALLDWNSDGALDVAVTQSGVDSVRVFLNGGRGQLLAGPAFKVSANANCVATGDLDSNGGDDLVVSCVLGEVVVIINKESQAPVKYTYVLGHNPGYIVVRDFDEDEDLDIAIVVNGSANGIRVMLNDGAGVFTLGQRLIGIGQSAQIDVADFNEDGHLDLVLGVSNSSLMNVLYGDGTGMFTRSSFSWSAQHGVAARDFDGDGHQDIAAASSGSGLLDILWGNGSGGFSGPTIVSVFSNGMLTSDDWNKDGRPDLVISSYFSHTQQTFVENLGSRSFTTGTVNLGVVGTQIFASGDLDRDGWPDLAAATTQPYSILSVLSNSLGPGSVVDALPDHGVPSRLAVTIEPNPAIQRINVVCELPHEGRATLELWDIQGRRVESREIASGAGRHTVSLGGEYRLSRGVYFMRLTQRGQVTTARACVVQ